MPDNGELMGKRNERRRQEALARRKAKRKKAKKAKQSLSPNLSGSSVLLACQSPVYECKMPTRLFEMGIGDVVFSRRLPLGKVSMALFLLDVFCLGVKDVFWHTVGPEKYAEIIAKLAHNGPLENIGPACARKLIDGAVEYARQFSLRPHPDYNVAQKIFGDVDAASCPLSFEYGRDGKPFYMAGPNDTPAKARQIVSMLEQHCGSDGFDYVVTAEL